MSQQFKSTLLNSDPENTIVELVKNGVAFQFSANEESKDWCHIGPDNWEETEARADRWGLAEGEFWGGGADFKRVCRMVRREELLKFTVLGSGWCGESLEDSELLDVATNPQSQHFDDIVKSIVCDEKMPLYLHAGMGRKPTHKQQEMVLESTVNDSVRLLLSTAAARELLKRKRDLIQRIADGF